jgi:uncharacterized RDD family membrane protein YckC
MRPRESPTTLPLDTTVDVETPERVRFSFKLAGPIERTLAYVIDLLVRGGILMVVAVVAQLTSLLGPRGLSGVGGGFMALFLFLVEWGYYVLSEHVTNGQSLGKRALGLRVVRIDGLPIGFGESLLRNLIRAADFLPMGYLLGVTVSTVDRRFRRLGDLAAGTMVVVERKQVVLPRVEITPPVTPNELVDIPLRPELSADELSAIELFLRRQETLNPAREEELAEMLAPLLARRMSLRYRNPSRFLGLLYTRLRGVTS